MAKRTDPGQSAIEETKRPERGGPELTLPQPAESAMTRSEETRVDPEIEAIVAARHGDPFAFLGMHETRRRIVRVEC